jgi:hypothetical protein
MANFPHVGELTARQTPTTLLLLYSDRSDPVAAIVIEHAARFKLDVIALSLSQLVDEVIVGNGWTWAGRSIDPSTTAVVNRLAAAADGTAGPLASMFQRQRFSSWLSFELQQFAYVSSMPTAVSPGGGFGSLLDQWSDLPQLVSGLRVPAHRTPWGQESLQGDVCVVNPWNLYSLGARVSALPASQAQDQLAYVRPAGVLFHVAQVGGAFIAVNAPPDVTRAQRDYVVTFAQTMAKVSAHRILEHAFFVAGELPVFYSTCPVPVITGRLPEYANMVVQGLLDDIDKHCRRAAA